MKEDPRTREELLGAVEKLSAQLEAARSNLEELGEGTRREAHERLELVLNSAQVGTWTWDLSGDRIVGDRNVAAVFGLREDEAADSAVATYLDRVHPEDRAAVEAELERALSEGGPFLADFRSVLPDGTERWIAARGEVALPRADRSGSLNGVVMDITEAKLAERALRESREDLNRAQAVAQTGSWRLNFRRNELLWSDEAHRIFGVPKGTPMTYETFLSTVHPEDRDYVHEKWSAALRGEPYDIEHRIVVNQRIKWVRERAELEFDGEDVLQGGFGTTQDITERKLVEETLRRSEGRLRLLAETSGRLLQSDHPDKVANELCARVMKHLDCDCFFNFLADENAGRLRLNAYSGIPEDAAAAIEWLDYGVAVCGCAARDAIRIVAENIQETSDPRSDLVRSFGVRAYACHPLLVQGRVIGTLSFGTRTRPVFTEDELELMGTVADQVAAAMERMRLLESERRRGEVLELRVRERTLDLERVNRTLAERSRELEAFFEHSLTPLCFLSRTFDFIRVNRAYAVSCQREISDFPGRNHFELYPHEENEAIFRRVVETGRPFEVIAKPFEFPDHPDWGVTYWNWTLTPVLDERGEVDFLVFSLEDVTKRFRAEEAVRENEERLRQVLETLPVGVWIVDARGRLVHGNPEARRIWGGARYVDMSRYGEYRGWWADTGQRIEAREWAAARAIEKGETSLDEEVEIEAFDGSRRVILNSALPFTDDGGEITGAVIVNQDITERREMERLKSVTNDLFRLFTVKGSRKEYLTAVADLLQRWSRCRCVGIRVLQRGGDIPYEATVGFRPEFLLSESCLSTGTHRCACTRVITGESGPEHGGLVTSAGSFRCENTREFVSGLPQTEREEFRGVCVENGFQSVALVPLRYRGEVLGLIHLADEREGWVPLSKVEPVEGMAPLIGEAIHRFIVEEDLDRAYQSQLLLDALLKSALKDLTPEQFLQRAMDMLAERPPPGFREVCGIFLSEGDGEAMTLQAHRGLSETLLRCAAFPGTDCACSRAAASGEVKCTEKDGPCEAAREDGGICSVPLRSSRGVTGVLLLGLREGERVDLVKQEFLKTLADVIASATEHKRAEEALRSSENRCRYLSSELLAAQESERRAIAQDVHDSLGATLAAAKIQLENIKAIKGKGAARAMAARIEDLLPLLRQTMEEVRRIQMALRPAMLDDLGLLPTMRWFCDQFQKSYGGIHLARDIGVEETDVPDHLQIVIFRILQEALNNVSKHSRADRVEVGLQKREGCLELSVGDNGMGFEGAAITSPRDQRRGLGLTSMRERAELSGGIFALESAPGKGTWVRASWPLPGDDGSLRGGHRRP